MNPEPGQESSHTGFVTGWSQHCMVCIGIMTCESAFILQGASY